MKSIFLIFIAFLSLQLYAQGTLEDYKIAESWMRHNVAKSIYTDYVTPHWLANTSEFHYMVQTRKGREYYRVNSVNETKDHAFNHDSLAALLSERHDTTYKPFKLPFRKIEIDTDQNILFTAHDTNYKYVSKENVLSIVPKKTIANEYKRISSPDSNYVAYIDSFNLFLIKNGEDTIQLSTDGEQNYDYAAGVSWYNTLNESIGQKEDPFMVASWSPDSKWLVVPRYDRRLTSKLYLLKTTPDKGYRSEVYSYVRPLAGDSLITRIEYVAFNVETGDRRVLGFEPSASYWEVGLNWHSSKSKIWTVNYERGFTASQFLELDPLTGEKRVVLSEEAEYSYIDPNIHEFHVLEKSNEVIWSSERDGWHHLYLYDYGSGELKNAITKGDFFVRQIEYIDTNERQIYFSACGKEKGEDPYFTHLYRVNFNGKKLELLTPENANHSISFSPNGKFFIDNYSRPDQPNFAKLYSVLNSDPLLYLEVADIKRLQNKGWKAPESFKLKGRDGKNDIYGLIYRPFNFDSSRTYPVIDATYSGPHTIRTPKTFGRALLNEDVALAQLGFIVVTIDGMGSAFRSKEFHDVSYKNLGDIGAPDHIKAIKSLAANYPYIDTNRIGIYGHSAGGYDVVRALLMYPDFYKVGVSSAGNHDHRIAKAWWPELYMGYPAGKEYDEQSNFTHADKLQGKLLLVHGNMDQNVNPAGTMRMADALIAANKDFDYLIINNCDHSQLYWNKYFMRKRWDYFVEHLLEVQPPKEYKIK